MPRWGTVEECREVVNADMKKIPDSLKIFDEESRNDPERNPWRKMVVGIVTCAKNKRRYNNFMEIFGDIFEQIGLEYYIINADLDIVPDDPSDDFVIDHESRVFTAKAFEAYENLAHKLAIFYSWVYNHTDYDYVIKADDGCLINLHAVITKLDLDYVGSILKPTSNRCHINKCKQDKYNKVDLDFKHDFDLIKDRSGKQAIPDSKIKELYDVRAAGGGYGYRLSRNALKNVDRYKSHILSVGLSYEDIIFSQVMFLEGIIPVGHWIGRYHAIGPNIGGK